MKNIFKVAAKFFKKHKFIAFFLIVGVAFSGYYSYKHFKNSAVASTSYVFAAVERGDLIFSVSSSGQVASLDSADLKPKTAGEVTYVAVKEGDAVKKGQLLAMVDKTDSQRSLNEAKLALDGAQDNLDDLLTPSTSNDIAQAENTLLQYENDLALARKAEATAEDDNQKTIQTAYSAGYDAVSSAFFKFSDLIQDLQDSLGTEKNAQEYIDGYALILGKDSLFIKKFVSDYEKAKDLYDANFSDFRATYRTSSNDDIYNLVEETITTARAISDAVESVRHMYDAILVSDYSSFYIAKTIDKQQPEIESDVSSISSSISSLESALDKIDQAVQDAPGNIIAIKLAVNTAQEKYNNQKEALDNLKAGADALDIANAQNTVAAKQAALEKAQEALNACYIVSPFDGVVSSLDIEVGDEISSGSNVATVITQQKIADITLNEVDVADIKVGQKSTITFDAIDDFSLVGEVSNVDTVGSTSGGVVSYNVQIALAGDDERIKPGMSLTANIITDIKQNVLIVPNSAVKEQNGQSYVQLLKAGEDVSTIAANITAVNAANYLTDMPVVVGASNDTMTEITSGINEGDEVVSQTTVSQSASGSSSQQSSSSFGMPGMTGGAVMRVGNFSR